MSTVFAADPASSPQPKSSDEPLPGLVSAPGKRPGIGRWQLARKSPRGRILATAWNGEGSQIAFSDHSYVRLCDARTLETKKVLVGHSSEVTSIDWNHRTNRIASASCDGTVRIWTNVGVPERILRPEAGEVKSVAWTSDGARLAAACDNGTVCLWKADGSGRQTIQASKSPVDCVAWSPDRSRLVSGDHDGQVKLWTADGKLVRVCDGYLSGVISVAWSPDGQHFASATFGEEEPNTERQHSELRIYTADGSAAASTTSERLVGGLCWSPDGQQLATYDPDQSIGVYDARGAELDRIPVRAFGISVLGGIAFAPKGREVAVGSAGVLTVVNLADRSARSSPSREGRQSARPDPIGTCSRDCEQWLVQFSQNEPYQVWSASDGNRGPKLPEANVDRTLAPAWNATGDQIAFVEQQNRLRVWKVGSPSTRLVLEAQNPLAFLAWSPEGDVLAVLDRAGNLKVVRTDGKAILERKIAPPVIDFRSQSGASLLESPVLFRADGKSMALVGREAVELIPLDGTKAEVVPYEKVAKGSWLIDSWWSNDGLRMTSLRRESHDFQLGSWHLGTGRRTALTDFPDEVTASDCSPDGKFVALGFDNGFWQLRRLDNLAVSPLESEPAVHVGTIRSVAFSKDSRRFATGGWDGVIKIWSTDGKLEQTLYGNDWPVHLLKWNSDGQRLMSVARGDGTTILWSLKTGRPELTFEMSGEAVTLLTRDGRLFGPSPAQLDQDYLGLLEKAAGDMEIVGYADSLALQPRR